MYYKFEYFKKNIVPKRDVTERTLLERRGEYRTQFRYEKLNNYNSVEVGTVI